MEESITITLGKENYFNCNFNSWVGSVIKVKEMKRTYAVVVKLQDENNHSFSITTIYKYKPAPKSTLINKSVFSKFKQPILR